ncbi:MAG: hypothetical protein INH41_29460 [Myxococcaceae bacterium]|nr:hypothetical protein [Myxococcaceae bacterium]
MMRWTAARLGVLGLTLGAVAQAQVTTVGEIVVVPDTTGSIHQRVMGFSLPGLVPAQGRACQDAARAALGVLADEYDFLVVVLSENVPGPTNTPAYQQARVTVQNIGQNPLLNDAQPFGSRAKLQGCLFMGSAVRLPADPDQRADLGSGNVGLTAVEVLGHEFGHAWLVGADYREGNMKQEDLRSGDRHYHPRVDSRSVMFGGCIDSLGGGAFRVSPCARKYNGLDQYFMGLLPASQVPPLRRIWGEGASDPPYPLAPGAPSVVIMGSERQISVDAVVQEMGARVPAFPNTQRCFRTGFVLVTRGAPVGEQLVKIDAYRRRFGEWFSWATDGNGAVDTRALGAGCVVPVVDGGVAVPEDGGTSMPTDGGVDGGVGEGALADAGKDAPPPGSGPPGERIENAVLRPAGCGCSSTDGAGLIALVVLVIAVRQRASVR